METKVRKRKSRGRRTPRKLKFSEEEMNRIQMLADLYAGGNFSRWVRYAALNAPRKVLTDEDK